MGRILTNTIAAAYAFESTLSKLPDTPAFFSVEPNDITSVGADVTTVERDPISASRQTQEGSVTDLDSSFEFAGDVTLSHVNDFAGAFIFTRPRGGQRLRGGAPLQALATTAGNYTHSELEAAIPEGTLVMARGFSAMANNGLDVVDSGSTTTVTPTVGGGQVVENPSLAQGAILETVGYRGEPGDLGWDFATRTLSSTLKDLTELGLTLGQMIHLGGADSANRFPEGALWGRVVSITANAVVLDKLLDVEEDDTLTEANGTKAGIELDVLFSRFFRNVPVDDVDFLETSVHWQLTLPNGGQDGAVLYEYPVGNYLNSAAFELPLSDKATVTFGFIGTDTEVPTETPKTNGTTPVKPKSRGAFNTTSGIAQIRLTGDSPLGGCFKSVNANFNNNVSPEKCMGRLGASYMNYGNFQSAIEAEMLFTEAAIIDAIRRNRTVTFDFGLVNNDGGFWVDLPSVKISGGGRSLPRDASKTISFTLNAFEDGTLGTSIGFSLFGYLPKSTIEAA